MNLDAIRVHCLNIPFVQSFAHAAKERSASDAVIVELRANGVTGYGEGLPRPYVSGETVESVVDHIQTVWPQVKKACTALEESTPQTLLRDIEREVLPWDRRTNPGACAELYVPNSARCALELGLVDCWLKARSLSASEILPPRRDQVIYSGVIATGDVERAAQLTRKMRQGGLTQVKVKVGDDHDEERLGAVRQLLGSEARIRIDANGAWDLQSATERLSALAQHHIGSCEEPLGRSRREDLAALTAASPIPTMVDESLVTLADAEWLIEHQACSAFNLRLSKLGGLFPCLRMAELAGEHGLFCQLGSHVGETAVLAAAGRHLALHLSELRAVEGSFGSLLLSQDIASPSIKFGHGGKAGKLGGQGLGAHVLHERLVEFAVRVWSAE